MVEKSYGTGGIFATLLLFLSLALPGAAWAEASLTAATPEGAYNISVELVGDGEAEVSVSVNGVQQPVQGAVASVGDLVSVTVVLTDQKACAVKGFTVARADGQAADRTRTDVEIGGADVNSSVHEFEYAHVYTFSMPASDVTARCELAEACRFWASCSNRMDNDLILVEKASGDIVGATIIHDRPPSPYESSWMSSGNCGWVYYVAAGEYEYRLYNGGELYDSGTVAAKAGENRGLAWQEVRMTINGVEVEGVGHVGTGECYYTANGGKKILPVAERRDDYGNYDAFFVLKGTEKGADYTLHVTPERDRCAFRSYTAESWLTVYNTGCVLQQRGCWQVSTNEYRVTVPEGSQLHAYRHPGVAYKEWDEVAPVSVETDDGKQTYAYDTVAGYLELVAGGVGTGFAKTYWSREFREENASVEMEVPGVGEAGHEVMDVLDGLYLSIADDGYRQTLEVGDEFALEGFRVYQPTLDGTSNRYVEPDMHYEVVVGDSVSVSDVQGGEGRRYATVTAVKPGVSIVKVTYDESYVAAPYDGSLTRFRATAPEQTGVVVFDVGGDGSCIDPGIGLRKYDTVYFANSVTQPDGAIEQGEGHGEYTFTPTVADGGEVSVETHKPVQMEGAFADSTWEAQHANADGSFTVPLYTGRNIVRISSGGAIRHFAINAMATDVAVSNKTSPGQAPRAGDEVGVSYTDLELPLQKMTAIYNPGWYDPSDQWGMSPDSGTYLVGALEGPDGATALRGERTQYNIRSVSELTFTVPRAGGYTLASAHIHSSHMGSGLDTHCNIPLTGLPPNLNADNNNSRADYCVLPNVPITVMPSEADEAAAAVSRAIAALPAPGDLSAADAGAVAAARAAYEALAPEARAVVSEADVLALELAEALVEKMALEERVGALDAGTAKLESKIAAAEERAKKAEEELAKATAAKKANTMTVTAKAKILKAKTLKKKAQTFKAVTVKNAKGKVTYAKVKVNKKKFAKKFTVNKNTGKITVKKGVKAGTYKVTVKVRAAGNAFYHTSTKNITVRIVVK